MTGVAFLSSRSLDSPGAWIFVAVVIVLIVLIFVRVYGRRGQPRRRAAHRSGQRTAHRASHAPEGGRSHRHRAESKRHPNRP